MSTITISSKHKGNIISKEQFAEIIETLVHDKKISYLEAITHYMSEAGMELDSIPKLIPQSIKDAIEAEATDLHLLKRHTKKIRLA